MRAIPVIALSLALAGCVAPQPKRPPPPIAPAPVCYSDEQCDAMWTEAMVQAQNLSGMRIQTATDSFLQTYNPTSFDRMGAMVRRMPNPDGSTTIEATFTCRYDCNNLNFEARNLFSASVKAAGARFGSVVAPVPVKQAAPAPQYAPPAQQAQTKEQQLEQLNRETGLSYEEYQRRYKAITAQ
ncbi:hypothetical protein LF844_09760 [Metapseudomonas lalkuanensis]|uniref:hypothetical protein n=1 Tax=Metapseudomonas lalkuanensis TaxID=2604832 RepID=UPI001CF1A224|nr:hypothetical protein [Pseudomonas lalkuanensis]UCP00075.1 hypothetical protein LF844_09760 [Pseudomonas lalkuanensis]